MMVVLYFFLFFDASGGVGISGVGQVPIAVLGFFFFFISLILATVIVLFRLITIAIDRCRSLVRIRRCLEWSLR